MTAAAADSTPSLARVYFRFLGDSYYKTLQKLIYSHKSKYHLTHKFLPHWWVGQASIRI
jgi:hypothetical protein